MPYISNKRPKPKPPQNNVMTISKALKAVNDNMDWTVLFIALLLVMVRKEHRQMLSFVVINLIVLAHLHFRLLVCTYILAGNNYIFQQ